MQAREGLDVDDKIARYFGYVIAFLAPGFLGLWALSKYSDEIKNWLGRAGQANTSVGDFLFVLVASLGIGVFLSGVRYFVFDKALFQVPWLKVPAPVADEAEARRMEGGKQVVYDDLRDQLYRYYQFYANTSVALALVFVAWWPPERSVAAAFLVTELVLVASARDSLCKFRRKKAALLGIIPPSNPGREERSSHDQRRGSPEESKIDSPEAVTAPTQTTTTTAVKADPEKGLTTGPER